MKKILLSLLTVTLISLLFGCGAGSESATKESEIELTKGNISDYLHIETTYELNGTNVMGEPLAKETITIYPTRDVSFNNVELILHAGAGDKWRLLEESTSIMQSEDNDSVVMTKISLPSDGKYEATYEFVGTLGGISINNLHENVDWKFTESDDEAIDEFYARKLPGFVNQGDKYVTGTVVE